jgi:NAD(P)H-flavin reductase
VKVLNKSEIEVLQRELYQCGSVLMTKIVKEWYCTTGQRIQLCFVQDLASADVRFDRKIIAESLLSPACV